MKITALLLAAGGVSAVSAFSPKEVADRINGRSDATFAATASSYFLDKYGGSLMVSHPMRPSGEFIDHNTTASSLPNAYDFRSEYSAKCKSPLQIFDQGSCGGCWAFSVAGTLSDRFCRGGKDVILSTQDLLNCVEVKIIFCSYFD